MHTRYTLVLSAILGGYLTNAAQHRGALITPAPIAPGLVPRQDLTCDVDYTACADSYGGCCMVGEPCTTSSGLPVCGADCDIAATTCPDGGCCNLGQECVLSMGNYYCTAGLIIPTYTAPDLLSSLSVTYTSSTPTSTSTTHAPSTTSDGSSYIDVLPSTSSSTSSEVFILSEVTAPGSSTSAAVTTSTSKAAGDAVSVAGPWTAGVLAWLTGLLMIA